MRKLNLKKLKSKTAITGPEEEDIDDIDVEIEDQSATEMPEIIEISPPEDIHFLSAFMILRDEKFGRHLVYSVCAKVIVLLQLIGAISLVVTMGNLNGLCDGNGECGRLKWCTFTPHPRAGSSIGAGRCLYCVTSDDLCEANGTVKNEMLWDTQQDSLKLASRSSLPRLIGYHLGRDDHKKMCSHCATFLSHGKSVDIISMNLLMGVREWLVYSLISLTASILIAWEATQWYKNVIILHRTEPKFWFSAGTGNLETGSVKGLMLGHLPSALVKDFHSQQRIWKYKYLSLQGLQDLRAGVLSTIIVNVPCFVMLDVSDPVSILVNAIATFFILEVDDLFYHMSSEHHPARTWAKKALQMRKEDADLIQRTKIMYFLTSLFALSLIKPLGKALGTAYLYFPALCLNLCAITSELALCDTWRNSWRVALRWFIFGFVFYWLINLLFIVWLPVVW